MKDLREDVGTCHPTIRPQIKTPDRADPTYLFCLESLCSLLPPARLWQPLYCCLTACSADLLNSEDNSSGLLGIAYTAGVCLHEYGLAVSVVEASPYDIEMTASTATHELGHK